MVPVSVCTHQQCKRVLISLHSSLAFIVRGIFFFFLDSHSDWCEVIPHLIVVLLCICLIMSDAEHLFICLLAIFRSFGGKCLFSSSTHYMIDLFVLILSSMSYLYILEINLLSVDLFANIFSHSERCLCVSLIARQDKNCLIFAVQNPLIMPHLFIFGFIFINLGDGSKKIFLSECSSYVFL